MNKRFQASRLLAVEALTNPTWAAYHLWGLIDQHFLMGHHQKLERELHVCPLEETVAALCDADASSVREVVREADQFLTGGTANCGSAARVIPENFDASQELQRLVYSVTRLTKPRIVAEVGVGRGATTAVLLSALEANGVGHLHSVEFPSLRAGYSRDVGVLVPDRLRSRWTLHWGPSQLVLPKLLKTIDPVDLCVHDGGHTYYTQYRDFDNLVQHLAPSGLVVFDDVNNDAFLEVAERRRMRWALVRQGKMDPTGVAMAPIDRTVA